MEISEDTITSEYDAESVPFENDTLRLIDLEIFRKDGNIEKSKFSFWPCTFWSS